MWTFNILTSIPTHYINRTKNLYRINIYKIKEEDIYNVIHGGGESVLIKVSVLENYIRKYFLKNCFPIIYISSQGKIINQDMIKEIIDGKRGGVNVICCKNEGIDERVISKYMIYKISIGNYIISSGHIAMTILIDSLIRLLRGHDFNYVKKSFINEESFGNGEYYKLIECPQYNGQYLWNKKLVPAILGIGNHNITNEWKLIKSIKYTILKRYKIWYKT